MNQKWGRSLSNAEGAPIHHLILIIPTSRRREFLNPHERYKFITSSLVFFRTKARAAKRILGINIFFTPSMP